MASTADGAEAPLSELEEAQARLREESRTTLGADQLRLIASCGQSHLEMLWQMEEDPRRCKALVKALANNTALDLVRAAVRRKDMTPAQVRVEITRNLDVASSLGLAWAGGGVKVPSGFPAGYAPLAKKK